MEDGSNILTEMVKLVKIQVTLEFENVLMSENTLIDEVFLMRMGVT